MKHFSIGQIASRTGLSVSAIRYYEDEGLVFPERNAGGQRRYVGADIRRLSFVLIAQRVGFSIARIRALLEALPAGRTPTRQDWARMAEGMRQDLDERIATLQAMREKMDSCIGCGCLSLDTCGLYNPTDQAGEKGAGPRYLMGDSPK